MTFEQFGLTGGELLALGEEHRRGMHQTPVAECARCLLKGLDLPADASVASKRVSVAGGVKGDGDGRGREDSPE